MQRAARKGETSLDPFSERTLRINVRPVVIAEKNESDERGVRGPFHASTSAASCGGRNRAAICGPVTSAALRSPR